jgi:hypothetical protein
MNPNTIENVKAYLLANIDGAAYDVELSTDAERVKFIAETFAREYGWTLKRIPRNRALSEWLAGLPTALTVDFYNSDVLARAVVLGLLPEDATEEQEDRLLENWWLYLGRILGRLIDGAVVPHLDEITRKRVLQFNPEPELAKMLQEADK